MTAGGMDLYTKVCNEVETSSGLFVLMIIDSWKKLSTESRLVNEHCQHIHLEQPNRWRVDVNVVLHIYHII